jgi:curli production assembly/transport component CsgF
VKKIIIPGVLFGASLLIVLPESRATELVYTPVNPSFGGSPLNGSFLLNQAESQNKFKNKVEDPDPFEDFQESVQRRILGVIANQVSDSIVTSDGKWKKGVSTVGGYTITVDVVGDEVNITMSDPLTGRGTTVTVPYIP